MQHFRERLKTVFPVSLNDAITTTNLLFCGVVLCMMFERGGVSDRCAPMVFVLVVFLTSRMTEGYLWGLSASIFAVIIVDYAFTEPFYTFDFMTSGYPVTFFTMFAVSFLTSTVTSRFKNDERLLRESEKERTRANLLRAVSHDLRTPLTAISGAIATVLEQDSLSREQETALLQNAAEESQWLIRMVENLLTVTRVDPEGDALKTSPEAAEEILAGAAGKFRSRYPGYTVRVSSPEELIFISVDATLIEQVLLNLLENAALHGETATEIALSVEAEKKNACIRVEDNGKGLPPEAIPTLFDGIRKRTESAESDHRRHMGLGLSVCRAIVEAHGGSISAQNRPEGGACFTILLPLYREEEP